MFKKIILFFLLWLLLPSFSLLLAKEEVKLLLPSELGVRAKIVRAIITATEAKTAALQDLKVPSTYSPEVLATGTGTDFTGGHSKMGELIGRAVYRAVREGLCKQNGFCE